VEFNVETIFAPILALFPIPVIITLPFELIISFTVSSKSMLIYCCNFFIALSSLVTVALPVCILIYIVLCILLLC